MRKKNFVDPATLKAVATLLAEMADNAVEMKRRGCRPPVFNPCDCDDEPDWNDPCDCFDDEPRFEPAPRRTTQSTKRWGVRGCPPEDKNKVFGIHIEVDEPRREDFTCRSSFLRARDKFDRLVDAAEAIDWQNKSNTAPRHRVNCIRKRVEDGPVFNRQLIGESHWF